MVPVIDGIIAGVEAAGTAYAISQSDEDYQRHHLLGSRTANIAIGAGLTTLFATSMGVGIDRVSRCKEADASFGRLHPGHPVSAPVGWTTEGVRREKSAARAEEDAEDEAAAQAQAQARAAAEAKAAGEAAARGKADQKKGQPSGE